LRKIVFIADFFASEVRGGGELNNEEFINIAKKKSYSVEKINSHLVTEGFLDKNKESFFIVANFINLNNGLRKYISDKLSYVIYEHDHKYISNRNPAEFENFIAPREMIVNYDFYSNAKAVFCQSKFHSDIVRKNLSLDNIISLGGNIWSEESLDLMKSFSKKKKKDRCSIMYSDTPHKNTREAILFCKYKEMGYEIIQPAPYHEFLDSLSNNDKLVFFPKTPETLSRIVVEAKMMGMTTLTNKIVGAASEEWFSLKGDQLIEQMKEKRQSITQAVLNFI
tara:strand:- start:38 stop:877 length:840 start_codon:yes stop_codon:yes gene_type:complete